MGSNAMTDVAAAAWATPRVGTRLLLATNFKLFLSSTSQLQDQPTCQDGRVQDQAKLPRDCEALINKQINMEFYASYVYLSMSSFFNRDYQALHGFADHFKKESSEERAHGMKLMEYQTKRGGRVVFQDIAKPTTMDWGSPMEAMEAALELEKTVNQS